MIINMNVNQKIEIDTDEISLKAIKLDSSNPESFLTNFEKS